MNEFDRDNLDFFINISEAEFDEWADQASDRELYYAIRLIQTARLELVNREIDLLDTVENVEEAANVLKKFTLSGQ